MQYYCCLNSPVGKLTVACNNHAVTGLWLEGQKHRPEIECGEYMPSHPILTAAAQWLYSYFDGKMPHISDLNLAPEGTPFQLSVWHTLTQIPYGATVTYAQVARLIGKPRACQAVGAAVGRNPISIIIPCHRVIGTDGSLTGYAGGLTAKKYLLALEGHTFP